MGKETYEHTFTMEYVADGTMECGTVICEKVAILYAKDKLITKQIDSRNVADHPSMLCGTVLV